MPPRTRSRRISTEGGLLAVMGEATMNVPRRRRAFQNPATSKEDLNGAVNSNPLPSKPNVQARRTRGKKSEVPIASTETVQSEPKAFSNAIASKSDEESEFQRGDLRGIPADISVQESCYLDVENPKRKPRSLKSDALKKEVMHNNSLASQFVKENIKGNQSTKKVNKVQRATPSPENIDIHEMPSINSQTADAIRNINSFMGRNTYTDDHTFQPKAIFPDENSSADVKDTWNRSSAQSDQDSESSNDDNNLSEEESFQDKSFKSGTLESSDTDVNDASTQEREFESEAGEENDDEESEESEEGEADSDNFIVGSDNDSDVEEDYTASSDGDEELFIDSDDEDEDFKLESKISKQRKTDKSFGSRHEPKRKVIIESDGDSSVNICDFGSPLDEIISREQPHMIAEEIDEKKEREKIELDLQESNQENSKSDCKDTDSSSFENQESIEQGIPPIEQLNTQNDAYLSNGHSDKESEAFEVVAEIIDDSLVNDEELVDAVVVNEGINSNMNCSMDSNSYPPGNESISAQGESSFEDDEDETVDFEVCHDDDTTVDISLEEEKGTKYFPEISIRHDDGSTKTEKISLANTYVTSMSDEELPRNDKPTSIDDVPNLTSPQFPQNSNGAKGVVFQSIAGDIIGESNTLLDESSSDITVAQLNGEKKGRRTSCETVMDSTTQNARKKDGSYESKKLQDELSLSICCLSTKDEKMCDIEKSLNDLTLNDQISPDGIVSIEESSNTSEYCVEGNEDLDGKLLPKCHEIKANCKLSTNCSVTDFHGAEKLNVESNPKVEEEKEQRNVVTLEQSIPKMPNTNYDPSVGNDLIVEERNRNEKKPTSRKLVRTGKWALGSKIGNGSFGVVHVGMNTHTGELMAVKTVKLSPSVIKDVKVEVDMLQSLSHINIVRYLGVERRASTLHIFQEWVPGGSLTTLLKKFGVFSTSVIRNYLSQILSGLSYLHDNRILHRDIKGGNVLVSDNGIVKLADFGSAKRLIHQHSDKMEILTMRGTPYFMAPEVFEERYNLKADVWSVGCVAFQMAMGIPPWKSEGFGNPISLFHHLKSSKGLPELNWSSNVLIRDSERESFEDMLQRCFCRLAQERPTCHGLSNHPFFMESSSSEEETSHCKGIFSICDESYSTFDAKTPATKSSSAIKRLSITNFLSPPMPRKIGIMNAVNVSPLEKSPAIDCKNWPSWAQDEFKKVVNLNLEAQPVPSPFVDSLAYSAETPISKNNPFARHSTESCPGTATSLLGLDLIDESDH